MYKHLNVTGDRDLADKDRFMLIKNSKTGSTDLLFFDGKHWKSLTNKRTGELLAPNTLKERSGALSVIKSVLNLDETLTALERSFSAATKLWLGLLKIFMLRHEKHRKVLTLICENF